MQTQQWQQPQQQKINPKFALIALIVLFALLALIYGRSLNAPLIFDDALFTYPEFRADYGNLLQLKVRALSYGSFVWIEQIFGQRWDVQRLVNVLIHAVNCVLLFVFYRALQPHFFAAKIDTQTPLVSDLAISLAVTVFAINPVAVYGVAYLAQRSISLATMFTLVMLLCVLKVAETDKRRYWVFALVAFAAALLSKEYVIMAPAIAIAVLVAVKRPTAKKLFAFAGVGVFVAVAAGYFLYQRYGGIVGIAFDELSTTYATQLSTQSPEVKEKLWPLSIMNEMRLFFEYGWRWFFPSTRFMSIDMRPEFPLSLTDWRYVLAAIGFVTLLISSIFLFLKYRGKRSFLGFCLLIPTLLFCTEFATVWIQDPFVLYRSYLWAIAVPGVVLLLASLLSSRVLVVTGCGVLVTFVPAAMDRTASMSSVLAVWDDAVKKLPNTLTLGQSRPFRARADTWRTDGEPNRALADYQRSSRLGDNGEGLLNTGTILFSAGRTQEALAAFEAARERGLKSPELFYNMGMTLSSLRRAEESYDAFSLALSATIDPKLETEVRVNRALVGIDLGKTAESIKDAQIAMRNEPTNHTALTALGVAQLAVGEIDNATVSLDKAITQKPSALAHYVRARVRLQSKDKVGAASDIDTAIALDPNNPKLLELRKLLGTPAVTGK
jgi:protein O-mannosyl-transferase